MNLQFFAVALFSCFITAIVLLLLMKKYTAYLLQAILTEFMQQFNTELVAENFSLRVDVQKEILLHFDEFMRTKLLTAMPVFKMFIDDKLIEELKIVFTEELLSVLPSIISKQLKDASANFQVKLQNIPEKATAIATKKILHLSPFLILIIVITGFITSLIFSYVFSQV